MKMLPSALAFFALWLNVGAASSDSLTTEEKEASGTVMSEPINPELLKKYDEEVLENPRSCKRRWQRSLLLLKHGEYRESTGEDIDTLLQHPVWRTQGERLKALHLYLQGHLDEAAALMRQNIRNNVNIVEQTRLLAGIELSRKDTAASIAVYRFAWDQYENENTFLELLKAYQGRGKPPADVLKRGEKFFAKDAAVSQALFDVYYNSGTQADFKKCLQLSARAEQTLWPRSLDWKINHARALLALRKSHEAEKVLLKAVDLIEEDPRLEGENGKFRREVFALLESAQGEKK